MAVLSPVVGQSQSVGTSQSRVDPNNSSFRRDEAVKERLDLLKSANSSLARSQKAETSLQNQNNSSELIASSRDSQGNVRDFSSGKTQGRGSLVDISV
ncbi:MAG: hypothetical protein JNN09_03705 [Alphaproteobacteria bacterium]|nr:hypothetical protein [Alphaproteobacteria bacterium]